MATSISDRPGAVPSINIPIAFDQLFDLDEALSLPEMPIQQNQDQDGNHDDDQIPEATPNPDDRTAVAQPVVDADSCAVCMESFDAREPREPIKCGHVYHSGCIVTWLSVCSSCPLCRRRVSGDNRRSSASKQ